MLLISFIVFVIPLATAAAETQNLIVTAAIVLCNIPAGKLAVAET
jgi:hypothetical protein